RPAHLPMAGTGLARLLFPYGYWPPNGLEIVRVSPAFADRWRPDDRSRGLLEENGAPSARISGLFRLPGGGGVCALAEFSSPGASPNQLASVESHHVLHAA